MYEHECEDCGNTWKTVSKFADCLMCGLLDEAGGKENGNS